ncbi:MAG: hypothetical protein FJZ00_02065 [Candidatus Sericytochromatia bacterium]|uniref:Uncharacterized protein n=1 Tax=Candidatus Tanganyikabacteria bacterium TaxID=2961651 RepID=A0A937X3Z0_9BACT|nr:hypothetical protein [Candidatus Tanganyikabacteria bacterium]
MRDQASDRGRAPRTSGVEEDFGKVRAFAEEAVEFWHRFTGDIARAKKSGAHPFPFRVERGPIEPRPDFIDRAALARYALARYAGRRS